MKTPLLALSRTFSLLAFVSVTTAALAQSTATLTPSAATYSSAGGTITFTANLTYTGSMGAIALEFVSPSGWTFGTVDTTTAPNVVPRTGDQGRLGFAYITAPTSPATFTFTVTYPAGLTGNQTFNSIKAIFRPGGTPVQVPLTDLVITPQTTSSGTPTGGQTPTTGGGIVVPPPPAPPAVPSVSDKPATTPPTTSTTPPSTDSSVTTPPAGSSTGTSSDTQNTSRIVSLSARSTAGTGCDTLIAGFVVAGGAGKSYLVRGIGPTLSSFGVPDTLNDLSLSLYSGSTQLASNEAWGTASNASAIASTAAALGAFSLPATSHDAVLLPTLGSGLYTAQVCGKADAKGVALVEVYDAASNTGARLVSASIRSQVGTGANVLIAGFTIAGNAPKQILIRAVGPSLASYGVTGLLADPQLTLYRQGTDAPIQQNDNWSGTAALKAAFVATGAFPLDDTSKDAALLVTLEPGNYSAQVSGVNGLTGVALVEVYEMP
jgi:hypothetical protein